MSEVTHVECGGIVILKRVVDRPERCNGCGADVRTGCDCPPSRQTSAVAVCQRCEAVIKSTDELYPQGAVCGVRFENVQSQRSAA